MKWITTLILLLTLMQFCSAQMLTLEECYARAESNYPLIRQRDLIQKTKMYSVANAAKGYLPQLTLGAQATYQSDVTQVPVEMPGIEPLSKDQYRIFGEVSQTLYNGGVTSRRKQTEEINAEVEMRKLEVELYKIKHRVNELFFGILLAQEQIVQSELVKQDLQAGLKKVEASIANGTAIPSAADVLRAELLRMDQRIVEMESTATSYRQILGLFINQTLGAGMVLVKPVFDPVSSAIDRPELRLFDSQMSSF